MGFGRDLAWRNKWMLQRYNEDIAITKYDFIFRKLLTKNESLP
jgi:hypothetical protein